MPVYEIHLTVAGSSPDLARAAARTGGSLLRLDLGHAAETTNLTWNVPGPFAHARAHADRSVAEVAAAGLAVHRIKIEAPMEPAPDRVEPAARYWELHALVRVPRARLAEVEALAAPFDARVSRRARRVEDTGDGMHERYLNLRAATEACAAARFDGLLAHLAAAGVPLVKVHRERVVVDTNLALDHDWLPVLTAAGGTP